MKKIIINSAITFIIMMTCTVNVSAQTDRPYTDGPLWEVQFVHTKPGMTDLYLKNISEGWVKQMRALKEQGVIMDYKILSSQPASENDWDLMFLFEIKNHAALDGLREKFESVDKKIFGAEDTQHKDAVSRNDLRILQGSKITQELEFK